MRLRLKVVEKRRRARFFGRVCSVLVAGWCEFKRVWAVKVVWKKVDEETKDDVAKKLLLLEVRKKVKKRKE